MQDNQYPFFFDHNIHKNSFPSIEEITSTSHSFLNDQNFHENRFPSIQEIISSADSLSEVWKDIYINNMMYAYEYNMQKNVAEEENQNIEDQV